MNKRLLNRIKTRTTRYMGKDGRWRAVLLWKDYLRLVKAVEK